MTAVATHTCMDCDVECSRKAQRCLSCERAFRRTPEGQAKASQNRIEYYAERHVSSPVAYIDRCPRPNCGARLFKTREVDYGQCLAHGTIYLGVPMPELSHETPAPRLAE